VTSSPSHLTSHPHLSPSPPTITSHPHLPSSPPTLTSHPHLLPSPPILTSHPHLPPSPPTLLPTLTSHPHLPPSHTPPHTITFLLQAPSAPQPYTSYLPQALERSVSPDSSAKPPPVPLKRSKTTKHQASRV